MRGTGPALSASLGQKQVSRTLRAMGLHIEDEYICPRSGYSIDIMIHDATPIVYQGRGAHGEGGGRIAIEFDGGSTIFLGFVGTRPAACC